MDPVPTGQVKTQLAAGVPDTTLRPEEQLLLCTARTTMDSEGAARIAALLEGGIDWEYLARISFQHRVMPLLYHSLQAVCPDAVPTTIMEQFRGHVLANTVGNLFLTRELVTLLSVFEAHEIHAIPYKGPVLAASVYGNLALRQCGDLDILIHKRDIRRTTDLLAAHGYQLQLTTEQQHVSLKHHYHYHFLRDDGRVSVELHWAFTRRYWPFPIAFDVLWDRLDAVPLSGRTVPHFCPEDLLLILCAHGAKHNWERLAWICDVAELLRVHKNMDWEAVTNRAGTLGSRRCLFLGLFLARDLLGASLPDDISRRTNADPAVRFLAAHVREGLLSTTREGNGDVYYLRLRERLRDVVPYILSRLPDYMAPSAKDRALLPLPAGLSFLYYPLRPIRLIWEHGLRPLARAALGRHRTPR